MKNMTKIGIAALLLVGLVGSAFAFSGMGFGNEKARDAVDRGDFEAWKEGMGSMLTEQKFEQLKQMRQNRVQMQQDMPEVHEAIENGDYEAWLAAIKDCPRAEELMEIVDEDNFETYAQLHQARQEKDFEKAHELSEQLGLDSFGGKNSKNSRMGNQRAGFGSCISEE